MIVVRLEDDTGNMVLVAALKATDCDIVLSEKEIGRTTKNYLREAMACRRSFTLIKF